MNSFKQLNKKQKIAHISIWALICLFLIFLYIFNQHIDRKPLIDTNGSTFEKATVVEIIQENRDPQGNQIGTQIIKAKIRTGKHQDKIVEATNIDSYLYGTDCQVNTPIIIQLSEHQNNLSASVYSYDRTQLLLAIIALFLITLVVIGKQKGLSSAIALAITFICILYLYLPMLYIGCSPFFSAVSVVIVTTFITMYFIGGLSIKTLCAIVGTIIGVIIAGLFASLFGMITKVSGYNVADIETLLYIGQSSSLNIGGLLFSGILIASLGAVMDVAMSIATTIEELKIHNPQLTTKQLFKSGIKIGGDMMGTMSNTLILAFTGGSLSTLMVFYAYNVPFLQMFNSYDIAIEIIQGISGSLGVILTVPIVSIIAAILMQKDHT